MKVLIEQDIQSSLVSDVTDRSWGKPNTELFQFICRVEKNIGKRITLNSNYETFLNKWKQVWVKQAQADLHMIFQ